MWHSGLSVPLLPRTLCDILPQGAEKTDTGNYFLIPASMNCQRENVDGKHYEGSLPLPAKRQDAEFSYCLAFES
ncbi:hypothetical protein ARMSODRAFT_967535 [Armillaria solidipes]|uniref:Uncharacterized protein n=1 Tax=Armillaria solidipes TaxID=1076256 RepID=A0A2H3APH6_9AGAR|nr:hypothetical protein ARMSODRAFT_967535 [Armillaria solidipes]